MIKYIKFDIFQIYRQLVHGFSTRKGGVSRGMFRELNLGLNTSDNSENVKENRRRYFRELDISGNRFVFPEQVHSDRIEFITEPGAVNSCDGLITDCADLFLTVQTADCFPVFLFDPEKKAVGLIHSGWRGTAKNITGKAIEKMIAHFKTNPQNMLAAIGPGVQQNCYQVDVALAQNFHHKYLIDDGPGHFKLDVQMVIIDQLVNAGVQKRNIEWDKTCTHCAKDLYYSYRRDATQSGRMMGILGIRNM